MLQQHCHRCLTVCLALFGALQPALSGQLPPQQIRWVDCNSHVPSTLLQEYPNLDLSELPATLHCGQIDVPMDYAKPIGTNNNITLRLAMHRPQNPKGVVFYNPGGTDPAAVMAWQAALNLTTATTPDFSDLLDYDLMMTDVRGTWGSNPLNVSLEVFAPLSGAYPTTESEFDDFQRASARMFQSWVDSSSPAGIIEHVGTWEVVRDYESIRVALGYDKIHFIGTSYGTFRAVQYAATFPDHVGHFVLDAIVPHGLSLFQQAQYDIVAANRGLLRADAFCQNNESCPFHNKGKGSIPKAYSQILGLAANSSLFSCTSSSSDSCNVTVTVSDVQSAMLAALLGQPNFPQIIGGLDSALPGNASGLLGPPVTDIAVFAVAPLLCSDNRLEDNTFGEFKRSFDAASELDSNNIGQTQSWQIQLWCSGRPYKTPANKIIPIKAPMLLVTADFDVDTATEKATFVWEQAPHSALLVRHGDVHGSFNLPLQPSTHIIKEFIRTGILPGPRNDTSLTIYAPGSCRDPIPSPYDVLTGPTAGDY